MKIRAIRLENVRRFVDPVEVCGFASGLNVLALANEQGKSTIFDALHAVFFKDAKSWDKEIRSLVPHAGGEPCIEVSFDHQDNSYRLRKTFVKSSGKGDVRIWRDAHLFLQSDAAEAWLRDLMQPPKEGGPAGLLWVRQGLTDFADDKETLSVRQSLLSSVSGEIDRVTGGQRMDAIRRDLRQSLDRLVTSRGARKGGALALAQEAVAKLQTQEQDLAAKVAELRGQLDQRRNMRAELADLQDPEQLQAREQRLMQAEAELAEAQRYQEKLQNHRDALATLEAREQASELTLGNLAAKFAELGAAEAAVQASQAAAQEAQQAFGQAQSALDGARQETILHRNSASAVQEQLADLQAKESHALRQARRRDLSERLQQARALEAERADLLSLVEQAPDATALQRLEKAWEALVFAKQARQRAAPVIKMRYDPGVSAEVTLAGKALTEGAAHPLPDGGEIHVQGIGVLEVTPGEQPKGDQLAAAQVAYEAALQALGCADLEAARKRQHQGQEAKHHLKALDLQLAVLAPDGLQDLETQLADLPQTALPVTAPPLEAAAPEMDAAELQAAVAVAKSRAEAAAQAEAQAQAKRDHRHLERESNDVRLEEARNRLERALLALGDADLARQERSKLEQSLSRLRQEAARVARDLEELERQAPDLAPVQARLQRAQSEQAATRSRHQELARDLAVLDSRISQTAGAAVEEELAQVQGELQSAQHRLEAVSFEVEVLKRLEQALEAARSSAQDTYLKPVLQELQPLLRQLWPEVSLTMDGNRLLPDQLQRGAQSEAYDALSGGTQEQIDLLVRLAFAQLLARSGSPAPVILDDAIVYTDDARIEKIFDALTLQAERIQILVFTCRQKSFRSLGGAVLSIRPVAKD